MGLSVKRPLMPRHYANQIAKLEALAERRAALEQVPDDYRELVKTHLRLIFERKRFERDQGHGETDNTGWRE
jgi:hypothetical protein